MNDTAHEMLRWEPLRGF